MHAHVSIASQDCDGRYHRTATLTADDGQDDKSFMTEILDLYRPDTEGSGWEMTPYGFEWDSPTEEGWESGTVDWCHKDDTDLPNSFRDFSAEAAGY